jgi:hypothetical protein
MKKLIQVTEKVLFDNGLLTRKPTIIEVEDLGDNIWCGPGDESFWFDGLGWFDENDQEWVEAGEEFEEIEA